MRSEVTAPKNLLVDISGEGSRQAEAGVCRLGCPIGLWRQHREALEVAEAKTRMCDEFGKAVETDFHLQGVLALRKTYLYKSTFSEVGQFSWITYLKDQVTVIMLLYNLYHSYEKKAQQLVYFNQIFKLYLHISLHNFLT